MDIYILNRNYKKIQDRLQHELPGYNVRVYPNVEDFLDYVKKTAVIADMLIVTDMGVLRDDIDMDTSALNLKHLLDYEFFDPKTVIFMNKKENESLLSKYEFIKRKLVSEKREAEIITQPTLELDDIRAVITRNTTSFKPLSTNKKAVVQVKRGARTITSTVLPVYSGEGTVAVELNKVDAIGQIVKLNHKDNETIIKGEGEEYPIEELPEDFEMSFEEVPKAPKSVKYITVTGDGGSGVSTTALTLALNGSQEAKTLLIDADTYLGLSNLIEQKIPGGKYYEIDLEKITEEKDTAIEDLILTTSTPNLHVMTITLPTVRAVGTEAIEYIILNLLSMLEDNYKYVIIDLPFRVINNYATLLSKSDLILASCPPYLNKLVALLGYIRTSKVIRNTKAYKNNLMMAYMTGTPDLNGLGPITIREFNAYSNDILNRVIPCTNPYVCMDNQYICLDRFHAILDKANKIFSKEED